MKIEERMYMRQRSVFLLFALILVLPAISRAQGNPNFSGTWKFASMDPTVDPRTGRPPGGGGGGAGAAGEDAYGSSVRTLFVANPQGFVITQTANQITVQVGGEKESFTLDNKLMATPEGDPNALKTWAHWDGAKLHLHFKMGMNWGRDVLSMNAGKLVVQRDVDSGGGSTTYTMTYTKS